MEKHLLALALGGFGIGVTEFVIMGLLPLVAEQLGVSIPEAGYLISAYALGVVIGAPLFTALGGRYSPKTWLIFLMGSFTLFNGISALAPGYCSLLVFRFFSGLPHGAYFGVGSVVASRLAAPGRGASAISTMFMGLTLANVVGVPLATYVGYHVGWRYAFAMVAAIGLATVVALRGWLPPLGADAGASLRRDLQIFNRGDLWICIALTSIGFGGFFALVSYIAPMLIGITGFSADAIPPLMTTVGVGMTVGIWWGGKLSDRYSALPTALVLMVMVMGLLLLTGWLAPYPWLVVPLIFLTGLVALAQVPPIQMLLIHHSQGGEMLGASIGQASFNIGNSLGAFFGGLPLIYGFSYASPPWVGAALSFIGIWIGLYLWRRQTIPDRFSLTE